MGKRYIFYGQGTGTTCAVGGSTGSTKKLYQFISIPCFDHRDKLREDCSCEPATIVFDRRIIDPDDRRESASGFRSCYILKQPPQIMSVCFFHVVWRVPLPERSQIPNEKMNTQKGDAVADTRINGSKKRPSSQAKRRPNGELKHTPTEFLNCSFPFFTYRVWCLET